MPEEIDELHRNPEVQADLMSIGWKIFDFFLNLEYYFSQNQGQFHTIYGYCIRVTWCFEISRFKKFATESTKWCQYFNFEAPGWQNSVPLKVSDALVPNTNQYTVIWSLNLHFYILSELCNPGLLNLKYFKI
jgi:hypothetical protein